MVNLKGKGRYLELEKIYFDHSATTPVHPAVAEEMVNFIRRDFGNPSSVHVFGRRARKAVEEAREKVAAALGALPEEIVFTAGGTESDNLAIRGVAYALKEKGNHIITSQIEHHAVLDTCKSLEKEGFSVTYLPVDECGLVDPKSVAAAITDQTILITVMHANNEVGTVLPVEELGRIAGERGVVFHCDAVQSFGKIPVRVGELNADLLSISAHKIYGPKGTGALYLKKGTPWRPLLFGGGQEMGRRPGTENVAGIVALGLAAELAVSEMPGEAERLLGLRERLIDGVLAKVKGSRLTGHRQRRLPNHASFVFEGVEGEALVLALDAHGIAASSGSACTSGNGHASHVLLAMGLAPQEARGSLRLTLGRENTGEDVDYFLEVLPGIVEKLRNIAVRVKFEWG